MDDLPQYEIIPVHTLYSDDLVRAIGEFFLASSTAEAALMFTLAELQCHPNQITINAISVLTGMQNKVMLQKLSEALAMVSPHHHAEFDSLCAKIRRVFEHRNNLAHCATVGGGGDQITVVVIKLGKKATTYHTAQIRGYTARLYQLVRHLSGRVREIGVKSTPEVKLPAPLEPGHPQLQDPTPSGQQIPDPPQSSEG